MKTILSYIFAVMMLAGAVGHVAAPEFYEPMIPDFLPPLLVNIAVAVVEGAIGVMLILPKYRGQGGLFFMFLMICFLPIHVWDLFRETPAVGEQPIPTIRLVVQFLMIYGGWWIYKKSNVQT